MTTSGDAVSPFYTDEQRIALDVRGTSVALSAGAGCGKTSVLTERFLLALDGADSLPLRSLVAVTFTEKAASELRKRIRSESRKRLSSAPEADVAQWRAVLRGLESAPVSTFHEYCAGLLRRRATEIGIDPDFRILDPTLAGPVLDEALNRCLRRWLADQDRDFFELAIEFEISRVRDALAALISRRDVSDLERWAEMDDLEVMTAWRSAWESKGLPILLTKLNRTVDSGIAWFEQTEYEHVKLKSFRSALLADLSSIKDRHDRESLEGVRARALLPRGLRAPNWPSSEIQEGTKAAAESIREAIDRFLKDSVPDDEISLSCVAFGRKLARLAVDARRAYDNAKRDRGGLDFDDLLIKAHELLSVSAPSIREERGRAVGFVLVDEFQDTDPIQSEILRLLCGDSFLNGRLFVVGDFKQSIYRFRGARPEIFKQYRNEFPEAGRLELTENFRSVQGVIHFVNALFADCFLPERPKLVPGPDSGQAHDAPAVEFVWAEEPEPLKPGQKPSTKSSVEVQRTTEARWLARLIASRLANHWRIVDRATKEARDAHAGDVAILFRAMTDLYFYEQALEAEGLDFHVVGGSAFYAQQEIQDLVNVLSVVENPLDPVALAGALRSPFFGVSDEGLFWLTNGGKTTIAEGLAGGCGGGSEELSERDRSLAIRANRLLERWRGLKDNVTIAALVNCVLDESGYEAALLAERLGDRKRANARKFVQLARRFDTAGDFTLGHFVARLRIDLEKPPKEGQAATTDEVGKSVRLMSIHQAKGLEFPIVIIPDLNRKPGGSRDFVAFDPELGVLVRPTGQSEVSGEGTEGSGKSLGWMTFETVEAAHEDAEAIRLFYVATTRARDFLILSAGVGPETKPESPALRLLDDRFDRKTGVCKAVLPDDWNDPVVNVILQPPPSSNAKASRPRRNLAEVAESILSAKLDRPKLIESFRDVPKCFDLDHARKRSPNRGRIERLIRGILADPGGLDPAALDEVSKRVARRCDPLILDFMRLEAVEQVRAWIEGSPGRKLVNFKKLMRGFDWSFAWPPGSDRPTVFLGRAEFIAKRENGTCEIFNFSLTDVTAPVERVRLLLSARAAEALKYGSVLKGWCVGPGSESGVVVEEIFNDHMIAEAINALFSSNIN